MMIIITICAEMNKGPSATLPLKPIPPRTDQFSEFIAP
jgi:hypothetical protein